jgi:hypothetical protein
MLSTPVLVDIFQKKWAGQETTCTFLPFINAGSRLPFCHPTENCGAHVIYRQALISSGRAEFFTV